MIKIRKVSISSHPILGNIVIDFCMPDGTAADTVIIAGENGCGKTALIDVLYGLCSRNPMSNINAEVELTSGIYNIQWIWLSNHSYRINTMHIRSGQSSSDFTSLYEKEHINGIYSDVEINYSSQNPTSVTSMTLDSEIGSKRSNNSLARQVKQLLIDIQALDDADVAARIRQNPHESYESLVVSERMPRFTNAFNVMFASLKYSRIENKGDHKEIVFQKDGVDIPIDQLSSGEKQIIYRGCFLLKDSNALNGAAVFIDEPEISLHPNWQKKIMEYYKGIFTNDAGMQTSQIFTVTHSPFIIHNENRKNDKVIILKRNEEGRIVVSDKPEYYTCNSIKAVEDAFSINDFSDIQSVVYLEGRTDEKYFNRALEVFNITPPFVFKWVGHIDANGQEVNTGKDSLNKAAQFLFGCNLTHKTVCLFDCDTKRQEVEKNNVFIRVILTYDNAKGMKIGIENALVLDDIDTAPFYSIKTKYGDYGNETTIQEFEKMEFCDYICGLETDALKAVFANLKTQIDSLVALYSEV